MFTVQLTESFESLRDDEDVVDANAEEEEGDDGVGRGVEQPEQRAQAVPQDHPHRNTERGAGKIFSEIMKNIWLNHEKYFFLALFLLKICIPLLILG